MTLFGFLNCNKPPGMTSRDVVNVVQRRLDKKTKVGHAGTLDPLAEGVLVLGVGPAVRLVPYVQQQLKHYRATFELGVSTASGDLEGDLERHDDLPRPSREEIQSAAAGLVGEVQQTPPAHSAIWVDGKRAYKRVRAGEDFEMPTRTVHIESIDVLNYEFPHLDLDIVCGSGTYIRTLGLDLALAARSIAVMSHLTRIGVGPFELADATSLDDLRNSDLKKLLVPASLAVQQLPQLVIDAEDCLRLGHGKCVEGHPKTQASTMASTGDGTPDAEVAAVRPDGELRAIVRWKKGAWWPHRVFPVG